MLDSFFQLESVREMGATLTPTPLDLEAVRAPTHVAVCDRHLSLMRAAGLAPSGRLRQQQCMDGHHAIDTLGIDSLRISFGPLAVHQCAGTPITIGRQLGDLRLDLVEQDRVACRLRASCSGVDPGLGASVQAMNV